MNNPAFKHVSRPGYELPNLMKVIGDVDGGEPIDDGMRNAVSAASLHANNAKETLLMGIESIGNILIRICELDTPIEQHDLMGIAGVIRHASVQVQYLIDVEDEMDSILRRDKEVVATTKGGAK